MARTAATSPVYQVPALEKGLDILEYLAAAGVPATQAHLARALGRGPNELFRMLVCLERRGYIRRNPASGAYALTLRLYELSRAHSPFEELLHAAVRPMQTLTETLLESCHLSVLQRGSLLVLAQEESPRPLRLSVKVGSTFPVFHTASGRLLLAYLSEDTREDSLRTSPEWNALTQDQQQAFGEQLATIRMRGFEEARSETTEGVHDIAVLVGAPGGAIQAALTVAALTRRNEAPRGDVLAALRHCANEIGRAAGLTRSIEGSTG